MAKKSYILGIDVGGTNIRAGLVDKNYQLSDFVIESSEQLMDDKQAVNHLISFIKKIMKRLESNKEIIGISIGFPSTIDKDRKKILSTPNIVGLDNIEIVDRLEEVLHIKTYINKDVNMLMLFDMFYHNIGDQGVVAGFYLGTGLGNAICINGNLLIGKNGAAAELGHIPTRDNQEQCGCGNQGCVENYASGRYLRRICLEKLNDTFIGDVFLNYSHHPTIKKFITDLAIPVAAEINILDPHYIIIGGGLIHMKNFPKKQLETAIHQYTRKPYPEQNMEIVYSIHGQENGVIGAGIHAFKEMKA